MQWTSLKKRMLFYLIMGLLWLLNAFSGRYTSSSFQAVINLTLILVVSFSIVYIFIKDLKSRREQLAGKQVLEAKKQEVFKELAEKVLETKKPGK